MDTHPRATLADVGQLAGVSAKSVSRVFNQPHLVNPETAALVLAAAARLRFRPNALAQNLQRGGRTRTIGFMIGELSNPFYYQVAAGLEQELARSGYRLFVATTDDTVAGEQRLADALLSQHVDALVIIPVADDQSYLEGELQHGTPIVSVDRPARNLDCDCVVLDNHRGALDATRRLLARGHRRIAYVCNPASVATQQERVAGYRQAMSDACIGKTAALEFLVDDRAQAAEDVVGAILDAPNPPTAIVCGNNRMMIGALRSMLARGDSSTAVVGFDDFDTADVLRASVVAYDPVELGRTAARVTIERIESPAKPSRRVVLPTWTIERGSGERPVLMGAGW